jgi:hypothetical protein
VGTGGGAAGTVGTGGSRRRRQAASCRRGHMGGGARHGHRAASRHRGRAAAGEVTITGAGVWARAAVQGCEQRRGRRRDTGGTDDGAVRAAMSAAEKMVSLPASILLPVQSLAVLVMRERKEAAGYKGRH